LATDASASGEGRQLAGRIGSYLGVIGVIGGLAFLASTLRGRRGEIDMMLTVGAGLGVLTAVGAGIEYWGWLAQSDGTVFGEMTSTPGVAMTLRIAGGLVIAAALVAAVWPTSGADQQQPARPLSASVLSEAERPAAAAGPVRRWDPRSTPVAWVGAALLVASFWFDGHTVSEGPRIVHAAVNSVHVVAAAVWVGGVISLLAVLVTRHRRDEPSRAAELIVRFSSIATVALAAVVLAGALMAVFVLDSPGDLTSTEWGKTLLLKTAAVGLAALGGAYNHFRLRPQLEAAPDDTHLEAEFRSTLIAEAIVLTFVVITTAWLVVAAT
jgi:copper transport protein